MKALIDKLEKKRTLSHDEWVTLFSQADDNTHEYAAKRAVEIRKKHYGCDIFIRGLIEFTSYCKNGCFYCGINCSNTNAVRFRLSEEEILSCCENGYSLGFRTFVLQGGEDNYFDDIRMCRIISSIRQRFPDCAITLSVGEKSRETYESYFKSGANRFLLRHETADNEHYMKLHPKSMSLENRKRCLYDLKDIGFQVGCGFMVGSPYQTTENLADDMLFIEKLRPDMVGIGPFISHKDTVFSEFENGSVTLTLFLLSCIRLMLPQVLLPATTALATLDPFGREKGILSGANVIMPNLSPEIAKKSYCLYDNKVTSGQEAAEFVTRLSNSMKKIGYYTVVSRGDRKKKGND